MSTAQHDLNLLLIDWDTLLTDYSKATRKAAEAEAEHKRLRARAIAKEKHENSKAALNLCEVLAESDEGVAAALSERLVSTAAVEAMKGKLAWFRSAADGKRSEIASDRENAKLYSGYGAGA